MPVYEFSCTTRMRRIIPFATHKSARPYAMPILVTWDQSFLNAPMTPVWAFQAQVETKTKLRPQTKQKPSKSTQTSRKTQAVHWETIINTSC